MSVLRDLCASVADLAGPPSPRERILTLLRLAVLSVILFGGSSLYWRWSVGVPALMAATVAGVAYALLLIATHEMVHGTLLGLPRLEQDLACLLSWPMAWPYSTYARLHRLHHRWNGSDHRDPERTTVLPEERRCGGQLRRWVHRHPVAWRLLVLGGVGLILDTAHKGWRLGAADPRLAAARWRDGLGVTLVHAGLLTLALAHGVLLRYLLFWIVLERVIGAIVQGRGLVEHHGLWQRRASHLLTQLYASRSLPAGPVLNAWMGGLPHHAAHHAFPWIASARLPLASRRIAAVLENHGLPAVPSSPGYGAALRALGGERMLEGLPQSRS